MLTVGIVTHRGESDEGFLISDRDRSGFQIGVSISVGWVGGLFFGYYSSTIYTQGWGSPLYVAIGCGLGYLLFGWFVTSLKEYADKHQLYMLPDYFSKKYSRRAGFSLLACNSALFFAWLMAQFVVGGQIVSSLTGMSYQMAVLLMTAITLPYLVLGGFRAVIRTDVVQYALLIVLAVIVIFSSNYSEVKELPPLDTVFSLDLKSMFCLIVMMGLWVIVSGDIWQRIYAAKDVKQARLGLVWAFVSYSVITPIVVWPFLISYGLIENVSEAEFLVAALKNAAPSGLSSFVALLLLISIMSTIDTCAFGTSMSITNDFLLKLNLIKEEKLAVCTKYTIAIVLIAAAIFSVFVSNIVDLVYAMMGLASCMAPALFCSFSQKLNAKEPVLFYSVILGIAAYLVRIISGWQDPLFDLMPFVVASAPILLAFLAKGSLKN